jgi:hypothetical protein
VRKKRKNIVGKEKDHETESEEMELETDMDNVFYNVDQLRDRSTIVP